MPLRAGLANPWSNLGWSGSCKPFSHKGKGMERAIGIDPTTFSLGTTSGRERTESDGEGRERTSQEVPTASAELERPICECDPDS